MKNAILLHGTGGTSQSNWLPWLRAQLEANGIDVYVPDLPHADYPSLREWTEFVMVNSPYPVSKETLLIGHSAGAVLALMLAQQSRVAGQVIAVGVFKDLMYLHDTLNWHANDRFFDVPFDFSAIQNACQRITFVHSNDDPYCPMAHAEYLAVQTDGTLHIIPNSGHFNTEKSSAFKEFPEILPLIAQ